MNRTWWLLSLLSTGCVSWRFNAPAAAVALEVYPQPGAVLTVTRVPKPWYAFRVHQIAVRHLLQAKASRAEARALPEDDFAALLDKGLAVGASLPPPSAEERLLDREVRLSCTQGMLLMLSREDRLALVLVDLLGFDAAEAATVRPAK